MNNFILIFHFESEAFTLIEIKRFLFNETDKSKLYFWLLFDKSISKLKRLNFVSMDFEGENEFRVFENEHLAFDDRKAVMISDDKEFFMDVISNEKELNINLQQAVEAFLVNNK